MAGTYSNIVLHIVFSTKNRYPFIVPELRPRLYDYLGGVVRGQQGVLFEIGGMADHVHLLIRSRPSVSVAELMREVKSESSTWVHRTFPAHEKFAWQNGYGVFSVSQSQVAVVKRYIATQEEHHRVRTFQDEFREFLRVHEIEYDERYIWE